MNDCLRAKRNASVRLAILFPFFYQTVAVFCLRHWGHSAPWRDLDPFSGGFIALTLVLLLYEIQFKRGTLLLPETIREAAGLTYDPMTVRWSSIQSVLDLAVFLDYGHWHLTPVLRTSALQSPGLALYTLAIVSLMWVDTCLARYFRASPTDRHLMTTGPFAIVRHPRYAGLLLAKLGFALVFASIFAWLSLLTSIFLIRRRIRLEELHLREVFGPTYGDYMQRTPCMLPGIY